MEIPDDWFKQLSETRARLILESWAAHRPPTDVSSCLLIVDVQRGFIGDETKHIPDLVQRAQEDYDCVIVSRFANMPQSLYRTVLKWDRLTPGDDETRLAFTKRTDAYILDKVTYTAANESCLNFIKAINLQSIDVCGIDTDQCVLKTALDLFDAGITPRVISNLCASTGGREMHEVGLTVLRGAIGADQVL